MIVYYAELQRSFVSVFIGVFSSTEKAQSAIKLERFQNARELLWIGFGDQLRANSPEGMYVIIPMEVDRIIEYGWKGMF